MSFTGNCEPRMLCPRLPAGLLSDLWPSLRILYNLLLLGFFYYGGRLVWRGFEIEAPISAIGRPVGVIHAAISTTEENRNEASPCPL